MKIKNNKFKLLCYGVGNRDKEREIKLKGKKKGFLIMEITY